eukprot:scaffold10304_cov79-Skeletonema_marinoi.AAC.1
MMLVSPQAKDDFELRMNYAMKLWCMTRHHDFIGHRKISLVTSHLMSSVSPLNNVDSSGSGPLRIYTTAF